MVTFMVVIIETLTYSQFRKIVSFVNLCCFWSQLLLTKLEDAFSQLGKKKGTSHLIIISIYINFKILF